MKRALQYLKSFEPARLRAVYVAGVALLVSLGLGQWEAHFDAKVQAIITAATVIVPVLQGELTRATVTPPGKIEAPHVDAPVDATPAADPDEPAVPDDSAVNAVPGIADADEVGDDPSAG